MKVTVSLKKLLNSWFDEKKINFSFFHSVSCISLSTLYKTYREIILLNSTKWFDEIFSSETDFFTFSHTAWVEKSKFTVKSTRFAHSINYVLSINLTTKKAMPSWFHVKSDYLQINSQFEAYLLEDKTLGGFAMMFLSYAFFIFVKHFCSFWAQTDPQMFSKLVKTLLVTLIL